METNEYSKNRIIAGIPNVCTVQYISGVCGQAELSVAASHILTCVCHKLKCLLPDPSVVECDIPPCC